MVGIGDSAIIGLAWCTGMRRAELAGLSISDIVATGNDEFDVTIHGKGDKTRTSYVYNGAALALADWLSARGQEQGPLFCPINRGGRLSIGHSLSTESLAQILAKRIQQARISHLAWHDFRRTFAGNLLDSGVDLVTVQKLMGHASPTTTSNYDRRDDAVRRKAVRALNVPYRKRL